jgi:hypothetical protein
MIDLSPEAQQKLARYADRGWFDAGGDPGASSRLPRPAYLALASGMQVLPSSEVQVTTRCYRAFRGQRLVVLSGAARRFDLLDLKIRYRSQFRRDEALPLRDCLDEAAPELIRWPLDVCGVGSDVVVRAIIPSQTTDEDPGAAFEMLLIGEI